MDTLFIRPGAAVEVKLHPVVLMSILDHHIRRGARQPRVMGALMGYTTGSAIMITNTIPVYHEEDEEDRFKVKRSTLTKMVHLNKRVYPSEGVVGWYATTRHPDEDEEVELVSGFTCAMHDMFVNEKYCARPIHLVVDASLRDDKLGVHAFDAVPNRLLKERLVIFQQIPVSLEVSEPERIGLDAMLMAEAAPRLGSRGPAGGGGGGGGGGDFDSFKGRSASLEQQTQSLLQSMERLRDMLEAVAQYVDDVVRHQREADPAIGRAIADALAAVPRIEPAKFDRMFNASLQDLLMVVYLSGLTQAQLALMDKMTRTLPYQ